MDFAVELKKGIGSLHLGMDEAAVRTLLGEPSSAEKIENAMEGESVVLHYDELGLTLFFEGEEPRLGCIDCCNEECTLFGEELFAQGERFLVQLMVAHGYCEQDVDQEDWGERRVSFPEANIDFYFDQGELASILLGT